MFGADRAKANTSKSGRRKRMRESESREREREREREIWKMCFGFGERGVGPKVFFPPVKIQVKLYPTNIKIKIGWISEQCVF